MPSIPVYTRRESIPGTSGALPIPVDVASDAGRALEVVGQSIAAFGFDRIKHSRQLQKQDEDDKIAGLAIRFDESMANEYIAYKQTYGDKSYKSQERLNDFQTKQLEGYTKEAGDSPRVQQEIGNYIQGRINNRRMDYAIHEADQRQVVATANRDLGVDRAEENAFNGIGGIEENIEALKKLIDDQQENNQIPPEAANVWFSEAKRRVAERTVAGMINRNPEASIEIMGSGVFNKYLDSKTIEHYTNEARQEADRQELIQKANIAKQKKVLEETANKKLTDALLDGKLDTSILGKYRKNLSGDKYQSWVEKYNTQIKNLSKDVDEKKAQTVEAALFVEAWAIDRLSTQQGVDDFKDKIADTVAKKELDPGKAREIWNDVQKIDKGNPERKAAIIQSIDSIEVAYKNGILGDGMESTIEREKMIRDLRIWSAQNPDKNPDEFTEKVLTAKKEHWIKGLFRILPGVSLSAESLTPQEMRTKIMNEQAKGNTLPNKTEISSIINENKYTKQSELVQYLKDNFNLSQEQAVNYLKGLR